MIVFPIMLCVINQIYFVNASNDTTRVLRTQIGNYTGILIGLSGFIVGQPPIFEMGYDTSNIFCYELACRNCFDNLVEKHNLTLKLFGKAYCDNCHRTYDLNNLGIVHTGDKGKPLHRYKVLSYSNDVLRIDN